MSQHTEVTLYCITEWFGRQVFAWMHAALHGLSWRRCLWSHHSDVFDIIRHVSQLTTGLRRGSIAGNLQNMTNWNRLMVDGGFLTVDVFGMHMQNVVTKAFMWSVAIKEIDVLGVTSNMLKHVPSICIMGMLMQPVTLPTILSALNVAFSMYVLNFNVLVLSCFTLVFCRSSYYCSLQLMAKKKMELPCTVAECKQWNDMQTYWSLVFDGSAKKSPNMNGLMCQVGNYNLDQVLNWWRFDQEDFKPTIIKDWLSMQKMKRKPHVQHTHYVVTMEHVYETFPAFFNTATFRGNVKHVISYNAQSLSELKTKLLVDMQSKTANTTRKSQHEKGTTSFNQTRKLPFLDSCKFWAKLSEGTLLPQESTVSMDEEDGNHEATQMSSVYWTKILEDVGLMTAFFKHMLHMMRFKRNASRRDFFLFLMQDSPMSSHIPKTSYWTDPILSAQEDVVYQPVCVQIEPICKRAAANAPPETSVPAGVRVTIGTDAFFLVVTQALFASEWTPT